MGIGPAAAQTAVPDVTGTTPGGSSITVDPNTNVSPSANIGTGNQNSSSDVGSGDQSTSTNQSSATNTGSGTQSADTSPGTTTSSPSASPNYGSDMSDKKTGLDRADEAAGSNGQQGRDNARRRGRGAARRLTASCRSSASITAWIRRGRSRTFSPC